MKSQVESGIIYLALAAGITVLWLTGAGAKGIAALRGAAAGSPILELPAFGPRRSTPIARRPAPAPRPVVGLPVA